MSFKRLHGESGSIIPSVLFRAIFETLLQLIATQDTPQKREFCVCSVLSLMLECAPLFDEAELRTGFFVDKYLSDALILQTISFTE